MDLIEIKTDEDLPPVDKFVLAKVIRTPATVDPEGSMFFVVRRAQGISLETREKMKKGIIADPVVSDPYHSGASTKRSPMRGTHRSEIIFSEDQSSTNPKPFAYLQNGVGPRFLSHEITHWCELPR